MVIMEDTNNNGKPQGRWTPEFTKSLQDLIKDAEKDGKSGCRIVTFDEDNHTFDALIISKRPLDKDQLGRFHDLCNKTAKNLISTKSVGTLMNHINESNNESVGHWTPKFKEHLKQLTHEAKENGGHVHVFGAPDNNNKMMNVIVISKDVLVDEQIKRFNDVCHETGKELPHANGTITIQTLKSYDVPQTGKIDYAGTTAEQNEYLTPETKKSIDDHLEDIRQTLEDMAFMSSILPPHYKIDEATRPGSLRCKSKTGITDSLEWDIIFSRTANHFDDRFLEVDHITNHNHIDFIVHLKARESQSGDMEAKVAKLKHIAKSAKTGIHAELSKIFEVPAPGSPEDLQIEQDIAFVRSVLPAHYTVLKSTYGDIRCLSDFGVDSPTEWKRIMKVIEDHFGTKLHDIDHKTNFQHVDFMIHLKPKRHMEPAPKEKIGTPTTDVQFIQNLLPAYNVVADFMESLLEPEKISYIKCNVKRNDDGTAVTDISPDWESALETIRFRFGDAFMSVIHHNELAFKESGLVGDFIITLKQN